MRGVSALSILGGFSRRLRGTSGSTTVISTLALAMLLGAGLGTGVLMPSQALSSLVAPQVPCSPYFVAGNVSLWTNTLVKTPEVGEPVWVNWTAFTNGSGGPNGWFTHSWMTGGKYQFDLPCGYVNGDVLTLNSHLLGNVNATAVNTTSVSVSPPHPGAYLDADLKAPALATTISAHPLQGESPLSVTFSSTHTGGSGIYTFGWRFKDGTYASSPNGSIAHTYVPIATYDAYFFFNDSLGDSVLSNVSAVNVVPPVSITSFTPSLTAFNDSALETFTTVVANGQANYVYAYQSGAGNNPTHTSASTTDTFALYYRGQASSTVGTQANVTVTDGAGKVAGPVSSTVWVYNISAHASLGLSYRPADAGQTIQFNGTAVGGGNYYAFHWQFADGPTSSANVRNPTHVYAAAGTYTVRFWANDSGHACGSSCPSTTLAITIHPALTVTLAANRTTVDVDQRVAFNDTGAQGTTPYTSYYTNYGDVRSSTSATSGFSTHAYAAAGAYTAQGWIVDTAGVNASSVGLTITVNAGLTVSGAIQNQTTGSPTNVAYVGETLVFRTTATLGTPTYTYSWAFGDGGTAAPQSGATTTHAYAAAGTYAAVFAVSDLGGGYAQTTVALQVVPALTFTSLTGNRTAGEAALSEMLTLTFANGVSWYHGNFSLGDGSAQVAFNGAATTVTLGHVYTKVENLTVNVTVSDQQGERVYGSLHIFVYPMLSVVIVPVFPSGNFYPPLNVTYTVRITGGSYNYPGTAWNFGDGNTSALLAPPVETYWHSGHYNASIQVTDNASDHMGAIHALSVWGQNYSVTWQKGWNLVALPSVQTNYDLWFLWKVLVLSGASPTTTQLAIQNTAGGTPLNYTFQGGVGPGANGPQAIADARGAWVYLASGPLAVHLSAGGPVASLTAPTSLLAGWNNLGWIVSSSTTASAVAALLPTASTISVWNAASQTYTDYIVGFDTPAGPYDFTVSNGQGFLVWVPSATSFTE